MSHEHFATAVIRSHLLNPAHEGEVAPADESRIDKERNLLGFGKITRDLTERKKIEGLLEADRRKNELLALLGREVSALTASTFKAASTIRFLPS